MEESMMLLGLPMNILLGVEGEESTFLPTSQTLGRCK